jgi:ADP-L-glycero-D-manno-heptose 6-epimerase
MKILVTGHRGFIGSNMLKHLSNHEVITYEWGDKYPDVTGLDWVIHMGAISYTTERNVEKVMTQNYDFSCCLLYDCIAKGVNFQYSSSASVYGLNKEFKETSPVDPKTPYAWSKYLFERYANTKLDSGIRIQGFRYFNVYGPGEDHKANQASPYHQFQKQFETTGKIKVFENSENYHRDFVPVDTVCETHIKFFDVTESGVWNVGTGKAKSFLEVAKSFTDNLETIPMPDILKDSYQSYTCADLTKLHNTLSRLR